MRAIMYVALAVWLPSTAGAQVIVTEQEALARLSPESPRVRALRAQIDVARAEASAAARLPNPRVTFSRESVAGVAEDYLTFAQPLPITGRRSLEIEAANASAAAVSLRVGDLERRARAELRRAFAALREAQAREDALRTAVALLHDLSAVLARREAAGDAAGFDRLRAEREVLDMEADRTEATIARRNAQAALAGFFAPGVQPGELRTADTAAASLAVPPLEDLIAKAETTRGDLHALQREADAADFSRRAAERRVVPEPEILAGIKTSNAGGADRGSVFSVLANLPLFDRGGPEKARAVARARQVQAQLEAERLRVRTDVSALREAVVQRRAAADGYRTAGVTAADDLQHIARVSYEAGERSILELLDAYRSASAARVRLASLEALVAQSEIELEYISGWENSR